MRARDTGTASWVHPHSQPAGGNSAEHGGNARAATGQPGRGMRAVLAYVTRHPGCTKAEARRADGASYEAVEQAVRCGHLREEAGRPGTGRLYLTESGARAAGPAPPDASRDAPGERTARAHRPPGAEAAPGTGTGPAPGLSRGLSALAGALLHGCGELTIGGRRYQVLPRPPASRAAPCTCGEKTAGCSPRGRRSGSARRTRAKPASGPARDFPGALRSPGPGTITA